MTNDKRNRVFWLGMHVVLTKTELPRLRELGYEVFNPPYLAADIYDQSAVCELDRQQPTTLPPEVFAELSRFNFFYNRITPRIAELLNEYFGTVIVTISPHWLESILEVYRGRIIYRVFGQPGIMLSDTMWNMRLFRAVQERDDFFFVPHAEETVREEHAWLKERMAIVPYTLPLDVFDHENTWNPDEPHAHEIMACCPNIDNPYYMGHYQYLNINFPESYIKLYGVQRRHIADSRMAGTLPRGELLGRYRRAAGYWYHYDVPNVCYLPPIEMMTVGGPVVYQRGSLLSRYFPTPGPGEAASIDDAKCKLRMLLAGDRGFVDELRSAQRPIARRYHPDHVHPIFDRTFRQLIDRADVPHQHPAVLSAGTQPGAGPRAYVFYHAPEEHVAFERGAYVGVDEISRTVKKAVHALLADTQRDVIVTCFADQLPCIYGYLNADRFGGRLRFQVLDAENVAPRPVKALSTVVAQPAASPEPPAATAVDTPAPAAPPASQRDKLKAAIKRTALAGLPVIARSRLLMGLAFLTCEMALQAFRLARRAREPLGAYRRRLEGIVAQWSQRFRGRDPWMLRRDCVEELNAQTGDTVVILPHASRFPEALLITRPMLVCLPDEAPAPRGGRMRARMHGIIGGWVSEKAQAVVSVAKIRQTWLFATPPAQHGWPTRTRLDDAHDHAAGEQARGAVVAGGKP